VGGYPGGSALTATGANNGWVPLISLGDSGHPNTVDFDYDFKTFVSPTAVHVPSSFVLFGIGTIGLLGYRAARHFIRGNISAE